MTPPIARILLIEDDAAAAGSLREVFTAEGYAVVWAGRGDEGLARAREAVFDLVLTDLRLPGLSGLDLVRELHAAQPRLPLILMTAHGTTETAIEATKLGAFDYLLKPFGMEELLALVARAVANARLMSEPVAVGSVTADRDALVGQSRLMQEVYKQIGLVANRPVNVLIRGETGTGKELVARALCQHSERAAAPFLALHCAAIPETLLESELFGHERGAFTGAAARRIGRFEQAHQGTVLLDEIGDLPPGTQVKLLRILQDRTLQRLGGSDLIAVDVRVIAATHRDLETAMREGQFREDLFYRLSGVTIHVPPLRDRQEDIPELVRYFLQKHGRDFGTDQPSIHADAVGLLQSQRWPGNVRELENVVRKALLLARGYTISEPHVRKALGTGPSVLPTGEPTLRELAAETLAAAQRGDVQGAYGHLLRAAEREIIGQAIELAQGNQSQAARWLGLSRLTLREKLTEFGLRPPPVDPCGGIDPAPTRRA
jgi:DNA-binding NtrC family response regulator